MRSGARDARGPEDEDHERAGGPRSPHDAFGIFRNATNHPCNNQSPFPDQPRPTIDAFKVNAQYFWGLEPLWRMRPGGPNPYTGPHEWIAFYQDYYSFPDIPVEQIDVWAEHVRVGEYDQFRIATKDRPGLFAQVAGALALNRADVFGAEAWTTIVSLSMP